MRRLRILAALLSAGALLLSACTSSGDTSSTYYFHGAQQVPKLIPVADRKPAENFGGELLSGAGKYTLKQDDGKVTVVNFWGAWCDPCQVETPNFQKVYKSYVTVSKPVAFVGIDVKEASRGLPQAFVKQHDITYPIVYDKNGEVALTLGNITTSVAPYTVLLDREHRVAGVYFGPLLPGDLEPMLNTLLAEK